MPLVWWRVCEMTVWKRQGGTKEEQLIPVYEPLDVTGDPPDGLPPGRYVATESGVRPEDTYNHVRNIRV